MKHYELYADYQQFPNCNTNFYMSSASSYKECERLGIKAGCLFNFAGTKYDTLDDAEKAFEDFQKKHGICTDPENGVHFCELCEVELDEDGGEVSFEHLKSHAQPVIKISFRNGFSEAHILCGGDEEVGTAFTSYELYKKLEGLAIDNILDAEEIDYKVIDEDGDLVTELFSCEIA